MQEGRRIRQSPDLGYCQLRARQRGLTASLGFGRTALLTFEPQPLRSQALGLFVERGNLIVDPISLVGPRLGFADLVQCLLDGQLACVSHVNLPLIHRHASKGQLCVGGGFGPIPGPGGRKRGAVRDVGD